MSTDGNVGVMRTTKDEALGLDSPSVFVIRVR